MEALLVNDFHVLLFVVIWIGIFILSVKINIFIHKIKARNSNFKDKLQNN